MRENLLIALGAFNAFILVYFILLNGVYLMTSLFAFRALRHYAWKTKAVDIEDLVTPAVAPPVTLIVPAYNEEASCVENVNSLLALRYPDTEILVVNDGSRDATLQKLTQAFDMVPAARAPLAAIPTERVLGVYHSRSHPNLWVIDKINGGGKTDANNAGVNFCRTPLFCCMDADCVLEREAITRLVRPFLEDATTVAAGGIIRIANGCVIEGGTITEVRLPKNFLARCQVLEYLRAFLSGRLGWGELDATFLVSGGFGLFKRAAVVEVGGYARGFMGEDLELTLHLHHHFRGAGKPYRITFIPDPVAWTQAPENLRSLGGQRDRWQRGLMESLRRHAGMILNPRYGRIGMLALPYCLFLEGTGPVVELAGYIAVATAVAINHWSWPYLLAFFAVSVFLGMALSIAAVALEELSLRRYSKLSQLIQLFVISLVENLGFRQLITFWRVKGFFKGLFGRKGWGQMDRQGFGPTAPVKAD